MTINKFIRIALVAAAAALTQPSMAQDLMARQAPIDKKLRTMDSVSIARLLRIERTETPGADLYPSWTNSYVYYKDATLPAEYKIDLRGFSMPCASRVVTSHYGYRAQFRRNHYGTDIKVYVGDTIRAAFNGKVRVVNYNGKGYGKYVIIRHPNGLETLYGHMSKQLVAENQVVKAGEPIGLGGNTGMSTGPHLHFETRFLGEFINPEHLFNFEAQDVLADYYVYHSKGKGNLVGERDLASNETSAPTNNKAEESRQFQEQKKDRASRSQIHKVKKGDTLSSIARKYHTTVDNLCRLNNISKNKTLSLGQIIKCS